MTQNPSEGLNDFAREEWAKIQKVFYPNDEFVSQFKAPEAALVRAVDLRVRKEFSETLERIYQRLLRQRQSITADELKEGYFDGNEDALHIIEDEQEKTKPGKEREDAKN